MGLFTAEMKVREGAFDGIKRAVSSEAIGAPDGPLAAVGTYVARDAIPAVFMSTGEGRWAPVIRGGTPLMLTGKLLAGFTWTVTGDRVRVTTTGKPPMVVGALNNGATIRAKNVDFLRFKIGKQWVSKEEVILPPRPWNVWFDWMVTGAVNAAKKSISRMLRAGRA